MKWFFRILDFYIQASIHVAFAVVALLIVSCRILNIPFTWPLVFFVFLSTVGCYNFIKYGFEYHKYDPKQSGRRQIIGFMSILSGLSATVLLYFFNNKVWWLMAVLLLVVLLYALPVFSQGEKPEEPRLGKTLPCGPYLDGNDCLLASNSL